MAVSRLITVEEHVSYSDIAQHSTQIAANPAPRSDPEFAASMREYGKTMAGGEDLGEARLAHMDAVGVDVQVVSHGTRHNAAANTMPVVDAWIEYPAETTRAASQMVVNGHRRDFPHAAVILSHAGGYLPYQTGRFEAFATIMPGTRPEEVAADVRSFYVDTALCGVRPTLAALVEFCRPDQVLFGTDYPACPLPVARDYANAVDAYLDEQDEPWERQAVAVDNALALLPRIREQWASIPEGTR